MEWIFAYILFYIQIKISKLLVTHFIQSHLTSSEKERTTNKQTKQNTNKFSLFYFDIRSADQTHSMCINLQSRMQIIKNKNKESSFTLTISFCSWCWCPLPEMYHLHQLRLLCPPPVVYDDTQPGRLEIDSVDHSCSIQ